MEKKTDNRMKKIGKNIIYAMILKVSVMFIQLISRIIFVKILSAEYLGINGLFSNILSVLSVADLGISSAMMYSLYKPIAENNEKKIFALVKYFKNIFYIIAFVILLLGLLLLPFLDSFINLDVEIRNLNFYYILFLINTVSTYLFVYRTILLTADQKDYIISKYNIIFQYIIFFFKNIILIVFHNYIIYLIIEIGLNIILNMYLNNVVLKKYQFSHSHIEVLLSKEEKKGIFQDVKALFLYKVCGVVQGNTDSILISIFAGTLLLGYYSNYTLIINSIVNVITLLFNSTKASIGNLLACEQKYEETIGIFKSLEIINYWLVGTIFVCMWGSIQEIIIFLFGIDYILEKIVAIVILVNFYTSNIRQSLWAYRETTGMFKKTKYITFITAIINLILSVWLGKLFGIIGVLGATIISRMVYAWWKEPIILYKYYFNRNSKEYFITYIIRFVCCIISCITCDIICKNIPTMNLLLTIICKLGLYFILFNIIFLIMHYRKKEFKYIINKFSMFVRT